MPLIHRKGKNGQPCARWTPEQKVLLRRRIINHKGRGKSKYPRIRWTAEQRELLRRRTAEGATAGTIAAEIGCNTWAIETARHLFQIHTVNRTIPRPWNAADTETLRAGVAAQLSHRAIGERLTPPRTKDAVAQRVARLGLSRKSTGRSYFSKEEREAIGRRAHERNEALILADAQRAASMIALSDKIARLRRWQQLHERKAA